MRIRIKFTRNEYVKYLGHLDIMRTFQRCFNRAEIRMMYSEGFNPHQKMSFAMPLGVGVLSTGEYLDAEVEEGQDPAEICGSLNKVCGQGFQILDVRKVQDGAQKAMAAVCYASYELKFDCAYDLKLNEYMNRPSILLTKKTKTGLKEVDVKQIIRKIEQRGNVLYMMLKCGDENSIRPELIAEDLADFSNISYQRDLMQITRTDLYAEGQISLNDYQTER